MVGRLNRLVGGAYACLSLSAQKYRLDGSHSCKRQWSAFNRLSSSAQASSCAEEEGEQANNKATAVRTGAWSMRALYKDIPLGSLLEVRCGQIPTDIRTICGPSTDSLKFIIRFSHCGGDTSMDNFFSPSAVRHGRRACTEDEENGKGREVVWLELPPLTDALAGPIVTAKLVAVVPRWYFGVSLDSGGGNVRLAEIKHASKAEVWSRGGRISSASTIQAVHVALNAQGGSILARRVVGQTVDISVKNETKLNTHAPEFRNRDRIVAPAVDIQSLAGVSVVVDAGSGKARVGSCHVDASGRISCGEFEAATFRGPVRDCSDSTHVDISHPDIEDCVLDLAPDGNAVIGGLDGCLHVRGEGGSSVDVQVNDGSHRLVVEMEQGNDANLVVGVSPTLMADVILKGRVDRCWLPQDAVKMLPSTEPSSKRGKTDTMSVNFGDELCVRLQPNEELHSPQDRKIPISRLQRGKDMVGVIDNKARSSMDDAQTRAGDEEVETLGNQSILFEMNNLPCQIVAKGCGNVEIRRRSWMEARMAGLLLSRRHAR